jgi:UDP-N-acetylmuramyl pentapeptide phosphotransferase/UDP-N-acetylglucosamine-1-phosphate transferase
MQNVFLQGVIALLTALLGTAYLLPKIISIVRFKHLMDDPNERSSHKEATPGLGGMAFYIILVISLYFNNSYDTYGVSTSWYPSLIILFFLGLKDDLVVLAPSTKLIGQIVASSFIVINPHFQITDLHGFCGIGEIPLWLGIGIAMILMLIVINSFNLIDGIDGLAALIGIVAFSGFAVVFFFAERDFMSLTCLVMVGILIGFLFFNLSTRNKIFMGDTGSMLIGLMLGIMAVRFLSLDTYSLNKLPFNAIDIPIIIVSFLIIPLFDTARVFTIRFINKKGIFTPDRNHLHHVIVDSYNLPHAKASMFVAIFNILCVGIIALVIKLTNMYVSLLIIFLMFASVSLYLYQLKRSKAFVVAKRRLTLLKKEGGNPLYE